jgi:hypothetical protein
MSHFAHVNNGIVDSVIVIEQDVLDANDGWYCPGCQVHKPASEWIQTSYNTDGGVHKLGGTPLRKNFAGIGFTYDSVKDAFIAPKPAGYNSWTLDENSCKWKAPKPHPLTTRADEGWYWSEEDEDWVKPKK